MRSALVWFCFVTAFVTLFATLAYSQQRVDPRFTYYRAFCILPLIGGVELNEPVRPKHIPLPGASRAERNGILGFYQEVSDDGKWALVEIVARDRASLAPILNDPTPGVWVAEKGRVPQSEILAAFQKFKKSVDLKHFGVVVQ